MLAVFCTLVIGFAFDDNSTILTKLTQNPQTMQCFASKRLKNKDFITYITKIT